MTAIDSIEIIEDPPLALIFLQLKILEERWVVFIERLDAGN